MIFSAGDVRDLFSADDVDSVHENMKNYAKDHGYESDRESCFKIFKEKVRKVHSACSIVPSFEDTRIWNRTLL